MTARLDIIPFYIWIEKYLSHYVCAGARGSATGTTIATCLMPKSFSLARRVCGVLAQRGVRIQHSGIEFRTWDSKREYASTCCGEGSQG